MGGNTVFEEILNLLTFETSGIFVEQSAVYDNIHLDLKKIDTNNRYLLFSLLKLFTSDIRNVILLSFIYCWFFGVQDGSLNFSKKFGIILHDISVCSV